MSIDLKYAIVRASPSRSGIFGSQPSFARASVMSGLRCSGSSAGSGRALMIVDLLPDSSTVISASSRIVNSPGLPMFTGPVTSLGAFMSARNPSSRSST